MRGVITAGIILALTTGAYASASTLGGLTSDTLGAGGDSVQRCDNDGVSIDYTVVDDAVTQVTISGINAACAGGRLSLALVDSSAAAVASGGPQIVTGSSHTLSVFPTPATDDVAGVDAVIEGP